MYPGPLHLFGTALSAWNATFVLAVLLGYPVLRIACRARGYPPPRYLALRYLATAYGAAVAAQWCAYLVDRHTSVLPAPEMSWVRYYFDPLAGPKTLYGAVLALPLLACTLWEPGRRFDYRATLDCWTPPLCAVLAMARVGCYLEGCCYGVPAPLGVAFPVGSPAYHRHFAAGLITPDAASLPVVPTQVIEALVLGGLAIAALSALAAGRRGIFPSTLAAYGLCRFAVELVRDDPERNVVGVFSVAQWIALGTLAAYALWRQAPGR